MTGSGTRAADSLSSGAGRYLEAIFYIEAEEGAVRATRLADWLGVAPPTVSEALRRLERDDLLASGPGRTIVFTPEGLAAAEDIVRRHRIAEVWLTEQLGFDWVAADREAHRIAHTLSEDVLARLHQSLGRPAVCPHGNVIPGEPQRERSLVALSDLRPGMAATVSRISEVAEHEAPNLLGTLHRAGLHPGARIEVADLAADGTATVRSRGRHTLALPASAARAVWVETSAVSV